MDAWTSNEPTSRSSVQPSGSSTNGQSMTFVITSPFASRTMRWRVSLSHSLGFPGSQLQVELTTTSILGRTPRRDRASVVFPVPWPPEMPTPPREGSMQASFRAVLTSSRPSTRVIGTVKPRQMGGASAASISAAATATRSSTSSTVATPAATRRRFVAAPRFRATRPPSAAPALASCAAVKERPLLASEGLSVEFKSGPFVTCLRASTLAPLLAALEWLASDATKPWLASTALAAQEPADTASAAAATAAPWAQGTLCCNLFDGIPSKIQPGGYCCPPALGRNIA
mmetsp:Transcript_102554/g.184949  ORF Transcript_102554/g.184949 Transcript_102554/m.184949 type:complete len:286 (+) Transcript_102554:1195-2052(+)